MSIEATAVAISATLCHLRAARAEELRSLRSLHASLRLISQAVQTSAACQDQIDFREPADFDVAGCPLDAIGTRFSAADEGVDAAVVRCAIDVVPVGSLTTATAYTVFVPLLARWIDDAELYPAVVGVLFESMASPSATPALADRTLRRFWRRIHAAVVTLIETTSDPDAVSRMQWLANSIARGAGLE